MNQQQKVDVFLIGAKSIGQYGGYESFVQKLLEYHKDNKKIKYHVACKANGDGYMDLTKLEGASYVKKKRFAYCNADCFFFTVPTWMKSAQAIYYDIAVLKEACKYIMINGA